MNKYIVNSALGLLFTSFTTWAGTTTISQKNQLFSKTHVTIKQGDSIKFLNEDDTFHNIFSLSDTIMFDLGSFGQGEAREQVFSEKGIVEVECAIHPNMKLTVDVQ